MLEHSNKLEVKPATDSELETAVATSVLTGTVMGNSLPFWVENETSWDGGVTPLLDGSAGEVMELLEFSSSMYLRVSSTPGLRYRNRNETIEERRAALVLKSADLVW